MNAQTPLTLNAPTENKFGPAHTWVKFSSFHYEGQDDALEPEKLTEAEFSNPILSGFYPDPSICRAGNLFYLINSSFSYYPGVPIFRSSDLVHWTPLGHILDRPSQLKLDGLNVSSGIFAPTISFHDGLFYMVTTNVGSGGNFFVTAQDPAGPWSEPIWLPRVGGIDPSFFFDDDGRGYLVHNGEPPNRKPLYDGHRAIWLWEFDAKTGNVKGEGQIIVNGGTDLSQKPVWIEGPHIFKRNGFYYLSAAEGGTSDNHSQVVFRSRSVLGPYEPFEGNPILTQRSLSPTRSHPVTCVGHADFVETPNGEWWAVFLGCRPYEPGLYNTGRETFLLPVTWQDDWPIILESGREVPHHLPRPALPAGGESQAPLSGSFSWNDDFQRKELGPYWNLLRTPRQIWWSLSETEKGIRIAPQSVSLHTIPNAPRETKGNPSFIARRQQHAHFTAEVTLEVDSQTMPCEAGLAALQNDTNYFFLGVEIDRSTPTSIFVEQHTNQPPANQQNTPELLIRAELPHNTKHISLRMVGAGRWYSFEYRLPGGNWTPLMNRVDGSILSTRAAGGFVGTCLGMYVRE